jgi:hypothetical protein
LVAGLGCLETKLLYPFPPEQQGHLAIDPSSVEADRGSEERRGSRPDINERHHSELW